MKAFDPIPPEWTQAAIHIHNFACPQCQANCSDAQSVWINRRAMVITQQHQRRWQEFYQCHCGQAWWAWSSDRPPTSLMQDHPQP